MTMSNPKFEDSSKLFFTSDLHFGHKHICEYSSRPFNSLEHMNEQLVENWNKVVPKDGIVFNLGDMFLCPLATSLSILKKLNGKTHYLYGNHENATWNEQLYSQFASRQHYLRIKVRDADLDDIPQSGGYQDVILFHYPIASWEKKSYKSLHLYGHCHSQLKIDIGQNAMDVGVDAVAALPSGSYSPLSYADVKRVLRERMGT